MCTVCAFIKRMTVKIIVFIDVPVVSLKMGSNLNPEDIKEGDDVYFECNIRANPKAYKLSWYHNVSGRPIVRTLIKGTP